MNEPRQFNLFKGKRQHGARLPAPKESNLHIALVKFCRTWMSPQWRMFHVPNGGQRNKREAALFKAMGVSPGVPDLIFVGPGKVFFVELKRRGESATDEQANWGLHIMRCGHAYLISNDLQDVLDALRDLGITRARVSV
jgi:hypothetical protein